MRKIQYVYPSPEIMMGPIKLHQAIPQTGIEQLSPFILLHHFDLQIEPGVNSFHVPPHPHRGFCPITYMFDGSVLHKDSLGNEAEIHAMEVQWIVAARGIIHSESISTEFVQQGGRFQGIQLWINLAAKDKMLPPQYKPITKEDMVMLEANNMTVQLVSGKLQGREGVVSSDSLTAMIHSEEGGEFSFDALGYETLALYILEGEMEVNGTLAFAKQLVLFDAEEGSVTITTNKESKALLLGGNVIHEPLVTHGPFVMNNETELLEAMRDYQQGKMGFLY